MNNQTITLDVRDDIRSGREPFSKIMAAAAKITVGEKLLIVAPFEPVPLFGVLESQGFSHASKTRSTGDWEVLFTRRQIAETNGGQAAEGGNWTSPRCVVDVDVRGLEPPQPLVKILEALNRLPEGGALDAHTDRRPMHLYSQLEDRGFTAETKELSDGSFLTHIRRR